MFPSKYNEFIKTFEDKPFGRVQVIYDSEDFQLYLIQEPFKRYFVSWKNKKTNISQVVEYEDVETGESELFRFMDMLYIEPTETHQKQMNV